MLSVALGLIGAPLAGCATPPGLSHPQPGPSRTPSPATTSRVLGSTVIESLRHLERRTARRIGVSVYDVITGHSVGYREAERFGMASTYKVLAVGCALMQVPDLDEVVRYSKSDLVAYSPVTTKHVREGLSLRDLCAAAVEVSDNTAANLLLHHVGGPHRINEFVRENVGDRQTRLDRYEPEVNETGLNEQRDSSTPQALASTYARLAGGDLLPPDRTTQLRSWLERCQTGLQQVRSVVPPGWLVGDKTGHGDHGTTNDVAVVSRPGADVTLSLAVLTDAKATDAPNRDDVVREAAAITFREVLR